ncbi:hypothetical protein BDQ17DRAFT_1478701, partial [Cyathus striatus]
LEPHIFWSLERSGAKPLTDFSATLIGLSTCANVAMTLKISYWDKFYYEALHDLYKMCGIITPDVLRHIGQSELASSKQGQEKKKHTEWWLHPIFKKQTSYIIEWHFVSPDISLLSWIGITTLEDGFAVLGTVYDTREQRSHCKEIYEAGLSHSADKDEWEKISHADIDDEGSDMDHIEELSEGATTSFDN